MNAEQNGTSLWTTEGAQAYQALCSFCGWMLYANPDKAMLARLIEQRSLLKESPFSEVTPSAQKFEAILDQGANDFEGFAREVHLDRTYLYSMIGQSRTTPYESVYRTEDSTMFGPSTLEVRHLYQRWGLRFDGQGNEPDDHVGIEFSFVAHLLEHVAEEGDDAADNAADGVNPESAGVALRAFLGEHLLVFAPTYLRNVEIRAKSAYYQAVACMAQEVLTSLAKVLHITARYSIDEARFKLG